MSLIDGIAIGIGALSLSLFTALVIRQKQIVLFSVRPEDKTRALMAQIARLQEINARLESHVKQLERELRDR